jgi:hypothetical protein
MSHGKVQKLMPKTRREKGRYAEFYVTNVTLAAEQPSEICTEEELIAKQREDFR